MCYLGITMSESKCCSSFRAWIYIPQGLRAEYSAPPTGRKDGPEPLQSPPVDERIGTPIDDNHKVLSTIHAGINIAISTHDHVYHGHDHACSARTENQSEISQNPLIFRLPVV